MTETIGKTNAELTELANEALRSQPGCETARITGLQRCRTSASGRNWEIPNVALGDSLISDVDRAVITCIADWAGKFHLSGMRRLHASSRLHRARRSRRGAMLIIRRAKTATSGIRNSA